MKTLIALTLAAIVLAVTVIALGRARVERALTTVSSQVSWSPGQIVRDRAEFLRHSATSGEEALGRIDALTLEVDQRHSRLLHARDEQKGNAAAGTDALRELSKLFREAEATNGWPVTWQGQARSREWVRQALHGLDLQTTSSVQALAALDREVAHVEQTRSRLAQAKITAGLATQKARAAATIQEADSELRRINQDVKELTIPALSGFDESAQSGPPSLDELRETRENTVSEGCIAEIVGRYGQAQ